MSPLHILAGLAFASGGIAAAAVLAIDAPAADSPALAHWAAEATAERISPAPAGPRDHVARWMGADGRPVAVVVRAPGPGSGAQAQVGPVNGDAGPAIAAALARVANGGTLRLLPGTYVVGAGADPASPALLLQGLHDVTIAGDGATLVIARPGLGIRIADSQRLTLTGLTIRYAGPAMVTGRVVAGAAGPELALPRALPAGAALTVHQATSFDPATGTYPSEGRRLILGRAGVRLPGTAAGRLDARALAGFRPGDTVAVKLDYYQGAAVQVLDSGSRPPSSDIVLAGIAIDNAPGMGVAVSAMGRGFALIGSRIGPASLATLPESVAYDGVHVGAAAGDILIQDNTIVGTGDDAINLASPILDVAPGGGDTAVPLRLAGAVRAGDRLALFDAALGYVGSAAVAGRSPTGADGVSTVRLAAPVSGAGSARYARDLRMIGSRYAVIGNRIGHCLCHGVLAQGPNGLVAGNSFVRLRSNPVRLLTSAAWKEGSGAQNVVVERNRIVGAGEEMRSGFAWGAITVYGELARSAPAVLPLNRDLLIRQNIIAGSGNGCIAIAAAAHVTLADNRCTDIRGTPITVDRSSTTAVAQY